LGKKQKRAEEMAQKTIQKELAFDKTSEQNARAVAEKEKQFVYFIVDFLYI